MESIIDAMTVEFIMDIVTVESIIDVVTAEPIIAIADNPPPFNPMAQSLQIMPYMGAQPINSTQHWQLYTSKYEHGYIIGKVSSSYTPTKTNTASQMDTKSFCQNSPMPQLLKGRPLD